MSSSSFSFFGKKQVYMIKWFALRILTSHCFIQSKYLILAPLAVHSIYSFLFKEESERDLTNFLNSHFCYGGCFTSKYGLVFLVTEMQKATTYLLMYIVFYYGLQAQLLYLYSTLVLVLHFTCTAHLCLLYKALMYILSFKKYNTNPLVFLTIYIQLDCFSSKLH